jgi:cell division protease FtsH
VLLGGRAAEELVFGEISSGASNDLERATDIARRMITELGMSEALGPVTFNRPRGPFALDPRDAMEGGRLYSEATARVMDDEVRRLLTAAHDRALAILERDRAVLEELARRLLEKEVVDRAELRELMGGPADEGEDRPEVGHIPPRAAA